MNLMLVNFIIHCTLCFAMTGINWFVQLVHYPMISQATKQESKLEKFHYEKTMPLAVPVLILESMTGIFLFFATDFGIAAINFLLILGILFTTFNYCVSSHCELKEKYSEKKMLDLMKYHFQRTLMWSIRSMLLAYLLYSSIIV